MKHTDIIPGRWYKAGSGCRFVTAGKVYLIAEVRDYHLAQRGYYVERYGLYGRSGITTLSSSQILEPCDPPPPSTPDKAPLPDGEWIESLDDESVQYIGYGFTDPEGESFWCVACRLDNGSIYQLMEPFPDGIPKKFKPFNKAELNHTNQHEKEGEPMGATTWTKKDMIRKAWDAGHHEGAAILAYVKEQFGIELSRGTLGPYLSELNRGNGTSRKQKAKAKPKHANTAPVQRDEKPAPAPHPLHWSKPDDDDEEVTADDFDKLAALCEEVGGFDFLTDYGGDMEQIIRGSTDLTIGQPNGMAKFCEAVAHSGGWDWFIRTSNRFTEIAAKMGLIHEK